MMKVSWVLNEQGPRFIHCKKLLNVSQLYIAVIILTILVFTGCGGVADPPEKAASMVSYLDYKQGPNSFTGQVQFQGFGLSSLTNYSFTVEAKPGSVSAPIHVSYNSLALGNRGYLQINPGSQAPTTASLPIYGLYPGFTNTVDIDLQFYDGSSTTMSLPITTNSYTDPSGIYTNPVVLKQRSPGTQLGFNYFAIKSSLGTPVILDTDGEVRWVSSGVSNSGSSIFVGDQFVVGDSAQPELYQLNLGGGMAQEALSAQVPSVTSFHHNIDPGKQGLFIELNTTADSGSQAEEITNTGTVLKTWDLGTILSAYMQANGDDPTAFVRRYLDWFHMNSMVYDSRDDSVIVSSRENFLIKFDYKTGNIIWIFGDPTKYWYTFPSLRNKSITLVGGGFYPIGQHAVSITSDGLVMVFNDGFGSLNQPSGEPAGETRTYSTASAYSIDESSRTAQEVWDFNYGQTIYSAVCGSVYEAAEHSHLIDYATADNFTYARLVGLDSTDNVVFDFQYPSTFCNTSWNAIPIPLDNLNVIQ